MRRIAEHVVDHLVDLAGEDRRVWLLDGDLGDSYGAQRFAQACPDRFVMAGIAEQNMVSMAAGMASCGALPFVFSFAAFLAYRAADQIRVGVAQSRLPVTLIGSHAGGCVGRNGRSHAAIGDIAALAALPGLEIWAPADRADVALMMKSVRQAEVPRYCRTPRTAVGRLPMQAEPGGDGLVRRSGSGEGMLLLSCGLAAHWAVEAQADLASRGIFCQTASVARLVPLPCALETLVTSATRLVIVEDHLRHGGLADLVAARFGRLPDLWFGWNDHGPGVADDLARKWAGLDSASIAARIAPLSTS